MKRLLSWALASLMTIGLVNAATMNDLAQIRGFKVEDIFPCQAGPDLRELGIPESIYTCFNVWLAGKPYQAIVSDPNTFEVEYLLAPKQGGGSKLVDPEDVIKADIADGAI